MGFFSWIDSVSSHPIWYGNSNGVRLLIPKEFGGGAHEGHYDCYGSVGGVDVYEKVADWNREWLAEHPEFLPYEQSFGGRQRLSERRWFDAYVHARSHREFEKKTGVEWRTVGISMACYDVDNARLLYPIKMTLDPAAVYEDVGWSLSDPWQGCECVCATKVRRLAAYRNSVERAARKAGLAQVPVPRMKYDFY